MSGVTIQVRHLNRTVWDEEKCEKKKLLTDISTDFKPGEVTAILGPSGCGKSTLLEAVCGITQADINENGKCPVYYNAQDYYENIEELHKCAAYLPQFDSAWLHDDLPVEQELDFITAIRNNKRVKKGKLFSDLNKQHIAVKRDAKIAKLSGGEKKRVAITGAKSASPKALFLDEPTAPLDAGMSAQLIEQLVEEAKEENLTTVMVTHDPIALQGLGGNSHVLLLKVTSKKTGGEVAFDGTYSQLADFLMDFYKVSNTEECLQHLFIDFSNGVNPDFSSIFKPQNSRIVRPEAVEINEPNSGGKQFLILLKREFSILLHQKSSLKTMLAIPLLLGFILGLVANKEELYTSYNMTKAMMFSLSACTFFSGVFDSISVFSNRRRITIEEFHGLRPIAYVLANAIVMTVLCFLQSLIIFLTFSKLAGLPEKTIWMTTRIGAR